MQEKNETKTVVMKIFDRWDISNVAVSDIGLKNYINLQTRLMPKSGGRYGNTQFYKSKMTIVERLANKLMVPGHRSKKHVITSGRAGGRYLTEIKTVKNVFERIEQLTKKNPVEVLVKAIENSAPREEIAAYQIGGIIVRRAVVTSPQRRVDLALKNIAQAAYRKSFGKKENIVDTLTNEIIAAYNKDASKSESIKEKERLERESEGAR